MLDYHKFTNTNANCIENLESWWLNLPELSMNLNQLYFDLPEMQCSLKTNTVVVVAAEIKESGA